MGDWLEFFVGIFGVTLEELLKREDFPGCWKFIDFLLMMVMIVGCLILLLVAIDFI